MFGRAAIRLGIGPHSSCTCISPQSRRSLVGEFSLQFIQCNETIFRAINKRTDAVAQVMDVSDLL